MPESLSIDSRVQKLVLGQQHVADDTISVASTLQDPLVKAALAPYYDVEPDAIAKPDLRYISCMFRFVSGLSCEAQSRLARFGIAAVIWCLTFAIVITSIWGVVHGRTRGWRTPHPGCLEQVRTVAQLLAHFATAFPLSCMIIRALPSNRSNLYQRTAAVCVFLLWVASALAAFSRNPFDSVMDNFVNPAHLGNLLCASSEVLANGLAIRRILVLEASHGIEGQSRHLFCLLTAFTVVYAIGVIMAPFYPGVLQHRFAGPVFITLAIAVIFMLLLIFSTTQALNAQVRCLQGVNSQVQSGKDEVSLALKKLKIERAAICTLFLTAALNIISTWLFFSPLGGQCLASSRYIFYAADGSAHAMCIAVLAFMQKDIVWSRREVANAEQGLETVGEAPEKVAQATPLDIEES